MNDTSLGNICSRCGKARIVTKTYQEKVGNSFVTYKLTSCPDDECQEKVDKKLHNENLKRESIQHEQVKRETERQERIKDKRKKKTNISS